MYTALYLPASSDDPSRDGFDTEEDAIQWIVDNYLCQSCKSEGWVSLCAAEWTIIETVKLCDCYNLGDILDNSEGFERIK